MYPEDLKYSETHQWVRVEGDIATVGMTDYAQEQMGDLVYLELPEVGAAVTAGESFGQVESVKAVNDITSPVSGEVTEVNSALLDAPETVNKSAYGDGWLIKVKLSDAGELASLLDNVAYEAHAAKQQG